MDLGYIAGLTSIIWLDIVLSGDNALVIGIAASTLRAELRRKAIIFGLVLATVVRIMFAAVATLLLDVPGLRLAGGLALLWVAWGLWSELSGSHGTQQAGGDDAIIDHAPRPDESNSLFKALVVITIADISMSIDNVLAVAAIARDDVNLLVLGLALSIALMGIGASLIVRVLTRYRWISYGGVVLLVLIAVYMIYEDIVHLGLVGRLLG